MTTPEGSADVGSSIGPISDGKPKDLREDILLLEGVDLQPAPNGGLGPEKIVRGSETVGYLVRTKSGWSLRYYSTRGGWRLETDRESALEIVRNGSGDKSGRRRRSQDPRGKTDPAKERSTRDPDGPRPDDPIETSG